MHFQETQAADIQIEGTEEKPLDAPVNEKEALVTTLELEIQDTETETNSQHDAVVQSDKLSSEQDFSVSRSI